VTDHDQRLKVLLRELFAEFFQMFFPDWVERFDFTRAEWLDKEVFTDPPQGERRYLDLLAHVPVRRAVLLPGAPQPEHWLILVHLEVESGESVEPLRRRMFEYYEPLRRQQGVPVLPVALYLRVGLDGVGWDVYEEFIWEHRVLHFEYAYVGLRALDAVPYLTGESLLGLALGALMKVPPERRIELRAEALRRVAESRDNDYRRYLVAECVQAYLPLDEAEWQRFQELLITNPRYEGVGPMMTTMYEKGLLDGKLGGKRETLERQLAHRFGPLNPATRARLEALSAEQLKGLEVAVLTARSLQELGLDAGDTPGNGS
jgi:hypothetical protein